jgi:hypothetical protein
MKVEDLTPELARSCDARTDTETVRRIVAVPACVAGIPPLSAFDHAVAGIRFSERT